MECENNWEGCGAFLGNPGCLCEKYWYTHVSGYGSPVLTAGGLCILGSRDGCLSNSFPLSLARGTLIGPRNPQKGSQLAAL